MLPSLKTGMVKNHQALLYDVMLFKNKGDKVILMWVPAHMGIIRKIAKKALQKESIEASISLSKSEGKSIVGGGGGGLLKNGNKGGTKNSKEDIYT